MKKVVLLLALFALSTVMSWAVPTGLYKATRGSAQFTINNDGYLYMLDSNGYVKYIYDDNGNIISGSVYEIVEEKNEGDYYTFRLRHKYSGNMQPGYSGWRYHNGEVEIETSLNPTRTFILQ